MTIATTLATIETAVSPIAMNLYDQQEQASILPLLARIPPGKVKVRDKRVNFEFWVAFPELNEWIDERQVQTAYRGSFPVDVKKYEFTEEIDRDSLEDGDALFNVADRTPGVVQAFSAGKVRLAYQVLLDGDITYDGQSFFDVAHQREDGSQYSNLLTEGTDFEAMGVTITPALLARQLKLAITTFDKIAIVRNALSLTTAATPASLVVIARNFDVWSAAFNLLTEERIEGNPNQWKGKFQVLHDQSPPAGLASSYDVIRALPNGPRPVVFFAVREPKGVQFDRTKDFSSAKLPWGMDARYAVAAAFPQTALRVELL